jgi:hypothetical protein
MKTSSSAWAGLLAACFGLGACAGPTSYRFGPALQDFEVRTQEGAEVIASVLVSVRGIAETGDGEYEQRFRLRVQNHRAGPLSLADAELVDAGLAAFGPGRCVPSPAPIDPGAEAIYDLGFPFPRHPDELDLSALNLRLTFREGDSAWSWSAGFERLHAYYHDHWHDPYLGHPWYGYGVGASVVWCD